MGWFNIEKVKTPSKEPADSKLVTIHDHYWVMDVADIPLYKMLNYDSLIEFYDRHNYFLARQYMIDRSTRTKTFYAAYRLTLTDHAKKIVNRMLSKPFKCKVEKQDDIIVTIYVCTASYMEFVPAPDDILQKGQWKAEISVYENGKVKVEHDVTAIPFNCGPLRPAWEQAVKCWLAKIARESKRKRATTTAAVTADIIDKIRRELLEYKYLFPYIIPLYRI